MGVKKGWYQDPKNAAQQRYWDGIQWSEAVRPNPDLNRGGRSSAGPWILAVLGLVLIAGAAAYLLVGPQAIRQWLGLGTGGTTPVATAPAPAGTGKDSTSKNTVEYTVTTDGNLVGRITYTDVQNGAAVPIEANGSPAPFSKTVSFTGAQNGMTVTAQSADGATAVGCSIKVNGTVVSEQSAPGAYGIATCQANVP